MNAPPDLNTLMPGLIEELTALRRELHRIPEIALDERTTRKRLLDELEGLPLEIHRPYLGTDIIADLLPPCSYTETVLLRADMDGLMIREEENRPWKSMHEGKMHACGHDGHMTILVGACRLLCHLRDRLTKRIRFVFQPGEEMRCAGKLLARSGAYEGCTEAYALHGWPGAPEGTIRTKGGVFFAATDTFAFTFIGNGTHGATPEKGTNPLPSAARFITAAEEIHRRAWEVQGSVVSCCIVSGGSSANIIPDRCAVEGTTRYLSREEGLALMKNLQDAARHAAAEGVDVAEHFDRLYDLPVINSEYHTDRLLALSRDLFGPESCERARTHDMVAEDFAFCLERVPGCFFQLGLGEDWPSLHTARFDFNDRTLERGILLFAALAGGLDEPI